MGFIDVSLMILIAGGALYILYLSLFKKRGCCEGCNFAATRGFCEKRGSKNEYESEK